MFKFTEILAVLVALFFLVGLTVTITYLLRHFVPHRPIYRKLAVQFVDFLSIAYLLWDIFIIYYFSVFYSGSFSYLPTYPSGRMLGIMIVISFILFSVILSLFIFIRDKKVWVTFLIFFNGLIATMIGTFWYVMY